MLCLMRMRRVPRRANRFHFSSVCEVCEKGKKIEPLDYYRKRCYSFNAKLKTVSGGKRAGFELMRVENETISET